MLVYLRRPVIKFGYGFMSLGRMFDKGGLVRYCGLTTASFLIMAITLLPVSSNSFAHDESPFLLQSHRRVSVTRTLREEKNFQDTTLAPEEGEQAKARAKRWAPVRNPFGISSSDSTPIPCVALCGETSAPEEQEQAKEKAKRGVPVRNPVSRSFSDSAIVPCVALCE